MLRILLCEQDSVYLRSTECGLSRGQLRAQRARARVGLHAHLAVPFSQEGWQVPTTLQSRSPAWALTLSCVSWLTGLAEWLDVSSLYFLWRWNKLQSTQQLNTRCAYDLGTRGQESRHRATGCSGQALPRLQLRFQRGCILMWRLPGEESVSQPDGLWAEFVSVPAGLWSLTVCWLSAGGHPLGSPPGLFRYDCYFIKSARGVLAPGHWQGSLLSCVTRVAFTTFAVFCGLERRHRPCLHEKGGDYIRMQITSACRLHLHPHAD